MKKEGKTIIIPEKSLKANDYFCDLCKKEMDDEEEIRNSYDIEKSRVYYSSGSCYPEGGSEKGEEFHICKNCMQRKIFPLIKNTFNIKSTIIEMDW